MENCVLPHKARGYCQKHYLKHYHSTRHKENLAKYGPRPKKLRKHSDQESHLSVFELENDFFPGIAINVYGSSPGGHPLSGRPLIDPNGKINSTVDLKQRQDLRKSPELWPDTRLMREIDVFNRQIQFGNSKAVQNLLPLALEAKDRGLLDQPVVEERAVDTRSWNQIRADRARARRQRLKASQRCTSCADPLAATSTIYCERHASKYNKTRKRST
jgi:hypothetical protein